MGSFQLSNTLRRERRRSEKANSKDATRADGLCLAQPPKLSSDCDALLLFCASNSQSIITFRVLSGVSSMMFRPVVEQRRNSIGGLRKTTRTCKNMRLDSADA